MTREQKIFGVLLLVILGISLMVKIDLFTADLGRHIKNGEIIFSGNSEARQAVLTTNYYSYTEGNSPFINHHWFSGVLFFLVFSLLGFSGLSILYIACMLAAFWFIFDLARTRAGPLTLGAISLIAIPVITSRAEVRPEVFTYLFAALFIWICWRYGEGILDKKWLWILPAVQLFWVNMHIGFIFGLFVLGVFFFNQFLKKDFIKARYLGIVTGISALATLVNPAFISGTLYPFKIFGIYTYRVFENQSITFLSNLGVGNPFTFFAYKALLILVLVSTIIALRVNWRKVSIPLIIFSIVFGYTGWSATRDFPLFGLVGILMLTVNIQAIRENKISFFRFVNNIDFLLLTGMTFILVGAVLVTGLIASRSTEFGIGIPTDSLNAATFFKENNLKGPIFNNYDIGGYLIYNLFPAEKVFFDNRPEAYTKNFVDTDYIAAMEDQALFNKLDGKYAFNAIFFYYRDYTPWGQAFITKKVFDPEWAPVYADSYAVILLKRNDQNRAFISKYEIPKETFRISD